MLPPFSAFSAKFERNRRSNLAFLSKHPILVIVTTDLQAPSRLKGSRSIRKEWL